MAETVREIKGGQEEIQSVLLVIGKEGRMEDGRSEGEGRAETECATKGVKTGRNFKN